MKIMTLLKRFPFSSSII